MEKIDITLEKRFKIILIALAISTLFLIFHLADLMSVLPAFLDSKIAYAPTREPIDIKALIELINYSE